MDEKPKSIWKKSWTGWRGLLLGWLVLMAVLLIGFLFLVAATGTSIARSGEELRLLGVVGIVVTLIFLLAAFIRWLCDLRNIKRSLFALACLATLIGLFYAEEDWRGWHTWNQFKQKWEAKGEHFDYASIIPTPVPDDQNFALTPVVASCYEYFFDKAGQEIRPRNTNVVDRLSMLTWRDDHSWAKVPKFESWQLTGKINLQVWQEYFRATPPTDSQQTNSFPVAPSPQSPADDVLLALSKYDSAIEDIREAGKLPYSRFPLTYGNGDPAAIALPHLNALRTCAQVLGLRSLAELQNRQGAKALEDIKLQLRLVESLRTEPFLISQYVRIAMLKLALQPVMEGLAENQWTDQQLSALDQEIKKMNLVADYKSVMRGEIGFQAGIIDYLRRQPEQFLNLSGENSGGKSVPFPAKIIWQSIPSGWFYQNQLNLSRITVEFYLPVADEVKLTISPTMTRQADAALKIETRRSTPYNLLERMLFPALGSAVEKFARAQALIQLSRTAIALERYRLAHEEYPESLDALALQFLEKVPHDVIGGGPLKYRRVASGQFVLYSIGWNEKDDGGVEVFKKNSSSELDASQGDWVWRYPQK